MVMAELPKAESCRKQGINPEFKISNGENQLNWKEKKKFYIYLKLKVLHKNGVVAK